MSNDTRLDRRTALKGLAGLAGAGALAGAGLTAVSGSAYATAAQDLDAGTVSSDDGTVEYVAMWGDSVVEWDGFDTEATHFSITIEGEVVQDWDGQTAAGPTTLHSTGQVALDSDWGNDESLSGPGTSGTIKSAIGLDGSGNHDPTTDWHVVGSDPDGYGLPSTRLPASALEVAEDGKTRNYTVTVRSTYTWYDANGSEILSETFTTDINVGVTNEPATATASSGNETDGAAAQ